MVKQIAAIGFVYLCVCAAWSFLGNVVLNRTSEQKLSLTQNVQSLWGGAHVQFAPSVSEVVDGTTKHPLSLSSSNIDVSLKLEQRKKGLLWYPTYKVSFNGVYEITNTTDEPKSIECDFKLPSAGAVYDNLKLTVGGRTISDLPNASGIVVTRAQLPPRATGQIIMAYDSQGLNEWCYKAGNGITQCKNFSLTMNTDFADVDFPAGTRSPTTKEKTDHGWKLQWRYNNTVSSNEIGMAMPKLLNPGPWVSEVTFFAPVSLFFFFFVVWLVTSIKSIRIHPMHYFFIGASFFSFHLLLAYSVDHIPIEPAFVIASVVSIVLVLTYIRRAIPDTRLFALIGLTQFIYLIFFSYTFFIEQFTGLIITCLSIFTLFLSMQYTARFDWNTLFKTGRLETQPDLQLLDQDYGMQT